MTIPTIWAQFHDRLHAFIESRVQDSATADDILQEVFIKVQLKLSSLADESKLTPWLYSITRNQISDHFRKSKHFVEYDTQDVSEEINASEYSDFICCLDPHLDKMPQIYRDALTQTDLGKLSQKEYADQNELSYPNAKSRVQRARQMLKEQLMECCKFETDVYGNVIDITERNPDCPC